MKRAALVRQSLALAIALSALAAAGFGKDSSKDTGNQDAPGIAPCISWVNPLMPPRAALLCVHGLGLYSGSYKDFGTRISRRGIACYAIDVRGFGSWMKSEGHEQVDFDGCLQDIKQALLSIRSAHPGMPVFLLGESMGGAIALRAASMYPDLIDGLISAVPAADRFKQKRTDLKVALELLKGPNKQFDIGKQIVDQATDNEKLRHDWEDDPLNRMNLSPKELIQFQKFMNENHDVVEKITTTPVLFVQGNKDKLVKPEGTWDLFNEVASEEKVFLAIPSEHLIFEEQQDKDAQHRENMVRYVTAWIFSHSKDEEALASDASTPALNAAISHLNAGRYQRALSGLRQAVQQDPQNGEAHYYLGMCLMKMNRPMMARKEFTSATRLGHGGGHAKEANNLLLSMDQSGASTGSTADSITAEALSTARSITRGKPTVLAFSASWCEQCQKTDKVLDQARSVFGQKLQVIRVDVEDHTNDSLVKAFNVGPIPTVVFLTADGKVSATQIGEQNFVNFGRHVKELMH